MLLCVRRNRSGRYRMFSPESNNEFVIGEEVRNHVGKELNGCCVLFLGEFNRSESGDSAFCMNFPLGFLIEVFNMPGSVQDGCRSVFRARTVAYRGFVRRRENDDLRFLECGKFFLYSQEI